MQRAAAVQHKLGREQALTAATSAAYMAWQELQSMSQQWELICRVWVTYQRSLQIVEHGLLLVYLR